jgi:hypothetical protein
MACNLSRAAGVLAGRKLGKARTATIRAAVINIPARLAFSAGTYTLHLPANSRRGRPFLTMFDNVQAHPKRPDPRPSASQARPSTTRTPR